MIYKICMVILKTVLTYSLHKYSTNKTKNVNQIYKLQKQIPLIVPHIFLMIVDNY